jgi:hypothetical protein
VVGAVIDYARVRDKVPATFILSVEYQWEQVQRRQTSEPYFKLLKSCTFAAYEVPAQRVDNYRYVRYSCQLSKEYVNGDTHAKVCISMHKCVEVSSTHLCCFALNDDCKKWLKKKKACTPKVCTSLYECAQQMLASHYAAIIYKDIL